MVRMVRTPAHPLCAVLPAIVSALLCVVAAPPASLAADYTFTTIIDNSGSITHQLGSLNQRKLNDSGQVGILGSKAFTTRLYRGDGVSLTHIAGPPTMSVFSQQGNGAVTNSGDVVFVGSTQSFSNGIYRGSGGAITTIRQNTNASHIAGSHRGFTNVSVSDSGNLAFLASSTTCSGSPSVTCTPTVHGTYAIIDGAEITLAETGATWSATIQYSPVVNNAGQVLFGMTSAVDSDIHLLRYSDGTLTPVDSDFAGGKGYWMNNAGDVITAESSAITLYSSGGNTTIASTADGFHSLTKVGTGEVFVNDTGHVAFWGSVNSFGGNPVTWQGVYTGPDILNDRVLVRGDTVLGHTIGDIELWGLNQAGQMLMSVTAQSPDNWRALVVATPPAPPTGDHNDDGLVDAADYILWRKSPNTYGGDPPGYDAWRANFGATLGSGSSRSSTQLPSSVIPEPTSAWLLLSFAATGVAKRRRRLHRPKVRATTRVVKLRAFSGS